VSGCATTCVVWKWGEWDMVVWDGGVGWRWCSMVGGAFDRFFVWWGPCGCGTGGRYVAGDVRVVGAGVTLAFGGVGRGFCCVVTPVGLGVWKVGVLRWGPVGVARGCCG